MRSKESWSIKTRRVWCWSLMRQWSSIRMWSTSSIGLIRSSAWQRWIQSLFISWRKIMRWTATPVSSRSVWGSCIAIRSHVNFAPCKFAMTVLRGKESSLSQLNRRMEAFLMQRSAKYVIASSSCLPTTVRKSILSSKVKQIFSTQFKGTRFSCNQQRRRSPKQNDYRKSYSKHRIITHLSWWVSIRKGPNLKRRLSAVKLCWIRSWTRCSCRRWKSRKWTKCSMRLTSNWCRLSRCSGSTNVFERRRLWRRKGRNW